MTRKTAKRLPPGSAEAVRPVRARSDSAPGVHERRRVSTPAVAGLTAEGLLAALAPQFAEAQQVQPNDKRIETSYVEFPSPEGNGKVRAYLAKPAKANGKLPLVLVVHENRRPESAYRRHRAAAGAG